jgi:polyphosphate kinase
LNLSFFQNFYNKKRSNQVVLPHMKLKKEKIINREISWLNFNARVLQEAKDPANPLLERLRFLGIFSNNRDEFFRVRVATLRRIRLLQREKPESFSYDAGKILREIREITEVQENQFSATYIDLVEKLRDHHIHIINESNLSAPEGEHIADYFRNHVRPDLFPIMLSSLKDPFSLKDNSIYLAVVLKDSACNVADNFALVKVPTSRLDRFYILPRQKGDAYRIIFLDDIIRFNLGEIFMPFGYNTFEAYAMKFTRDAELDIDNDISKSFLEIMVESLKQRKKGATVRFVYDKSMPEYLLDRLLKKFKITKNDVLRGGARYHNLRDLMDFPRIGDLSLYYPNMPPIRHNAFPPHESIFKVIRERDVMLHFPYQSFHHIIDLLREASIDPKVRSIKMTLYRAARDSSVINALINAARNGKSVTVFLELQARFDEKANIAWSEKLQDEGVKIIKTIPGFKVHSKLLLIRRKEDGQNVYYSNISTGNFNESTARIYADDSLMTANEDIGIEVSQMFKLFEAPYSPPEFKKLIVSPYQTRRHFLAMLNREIRNAKAGKDSWVIIKMNSLVDEKLIEKLFQASNAGVKIKIICRGICVLVPGLPGTSDNIEVISIVDKFLEHSRIVVFSNENNPAMYIGSADWMVRNLDNRFEVCVQITDHDLRNELLTMLNIQLADNTKARKLNGPIENEYRKTDAMEQVRSQFAIYEYLKKMNGV